MAVIRRRSPEGGESGFTLLEVLLAMTILGVGILSIGLAQLSSMKMSSRSRALQQGMYLAQERMDEFMALPAGDAELSTAAADVADPAGTIHAFAEDSEDRVAYTRSWTIEPNTPQLGLSRITVEVSWDSADKATQRVQLRGIRRLGS